ncbi:MAG: preprotein translocase subunit SecA, partial [Fulvivirga sp.]
EVIYKRRRNALYGERLELDIMNMLFDTCEDIIANTKGTDNYDSFKLTTLGVLGIDFNISQEEFETIGEEDLAHKLYSAAFDHYKRKNEAIAERALPIIKNIEETRGATIENILVPFTDGKKQIGVAANLKKCVATDNKELIKAMEKMATLALIDQLWKDHLREMDDLKQSVQNAVYEQKDPLLIYKFEGFELFKRFIAKVNEDTISFLVKADLPVEDPNQVQEARQARKQKLNEKKEESRSLLSGGGQPAANRPPAEKTMPLKSEKIVGRNDRVTVQYMDGSLKKDVKFKTVEADINSKKCVLVEE